MKPDASFSFSRRPGAHAIATAPSPNPTSTQPACLIWRMVGMLSVAIGIVNAFIPLLPTTVFLLIGVWAYGRGDPAMRQRLLNHPRYGTALTLWVDKRQISRRGKLASCCGIALSATFTLAMIGPHKPIGWAIAGGLLALCVYLLTRAEPQAA